MRSPVFTTFGWSRLVTSAFEKHKYLFQDHSFWDLWDWLPSLSQPPPTKYTPLPGLLAMHIRRGDFSDHCLHLEKFSSSFNSFNLLPGLPDHFSPPPEGVSPERTAIYLKHCYPTLEQIVEKVLAVKADAAARGKTLNRIHIMTNGKVLGAIGLVAGVVVIVSAVSTDADVGAVWRL